MSNVISFPLACKSNSSGPSDKNHFGANEQVENLLSFEMSGLDLLLKKRRYKDFVELSHSQLEAGIIIDINIDVAINSILDTPEELLSFYYEVIDNHSNDQKYQNILKIIGEIIEKDVGAKARDIYTSTDRNISTFLRLHSMYEEYEKYLHKIGKPKNFLFDYVEIYVSALLGNYMSDKQYKMIIIFISSHRSKLAPFKEKIYGFIDRMDDMRTIGKSSVDNKAMELFYRQICDLLLIPYNNPNHNGLRII